MHSLHQLNSLIDDGTGFIGQLTSKAGKLLRFLSGDGSVVEEISVDWINEEELRALSLDERYYVIEEFSGEAEDKTGGVYKIYLYDLTGKLIKTIQRDY